MGGKSAKVKGASGEREVCKLLNGVIAEVRNTLGFDAFAEIDLPFQRNQNQSAVGGDDITNPFSLSIEVKRQEQLSINTWWNQCKISSARTENSIPILIFRQNGKKWRVMMETYIPLQSNLAFGPLRVEITIDDFLNWFKNYYIEYLKNK